MVEIMIELNYTKLRLNCVIDNSKLVHMTVCAV